jgi:hypothetical protein
MDREREDISVPEISEPAIGASECHAAKARAHYDKQLFGECSFGHFFHSSVLHVVL